MREVIVLVLVWWLAYIVLVPAGPRPIGPRDPHKYDWIEHNG